MTLDAEAGSTRECETQKEGNAGDILLYERQKVARATKGGDNRKPEFKVLRP